MNLQLKKFNMSSIKDDSVVVLIGKRNTGKSYLTKDLLYNNRDIPVGTVISPTEMANKFYSSMVPPIFIHDEYTPPVVSNVVKRQKKLKKIVNTPNNNTNEENLDLRTFLILDDCLYDNSWQKDKNIRNIFMNGRHYNILFILTMQFALGIPPNLRTNIDYVFILRENIVSNRKRIYDHYAGMFPTFDMFCSTMDQCTENFECLVICNNAKSNKIEDQVFWYKAESHPEFRMGPDDVWDYSNSNYTADKNSDDDVDINNYTKNRGVSLKIDKLDDYNY
jgi:hypothetical protein